MMDYDAITERIKDSKPDQKAYKEQEYYEKAVTKRYKQDTKFKRFLTKWAMNVVSFYLIVVLAILVTNNFGITLGLSDTVLSVLLGTTTVNVLGLMYIVLKGYFKEI